MTNVYSQHKPEVSGGLYLKLEDGQSVRVRFYGEPVIFNSEYLGKLSTRYAWVVWNTEAKVAQVWQGSATFFKSLAAYANDADYGDPSEYDVKVKRSGTGTDTTYELVAGRNNYKLDAEAVDACNKLNLIEAISKGQSNSGIYWLSDVVEGKTTQAKPAAPAKSINDYGPDEPINTDEMPEDFLQGDSIADDVDVPF